MSVNPFTKFLLIAATVLAVGTGVAIAAGTNGGSSSDPATTGVDVKGPCDELEHATDPSCAGAQIPEDNQAEDQADDHGHDNSNQDDDPAEAEDRNDDNAHGDDPAEVEDNDDQGEDNDDQGEVEDQNDDNSGPSANSGPGSSHDDNDADEDHFGHGGGDDDSGQGLDDGGNSGPGGGDDDYPLGGAFRPDGAREGPVLVLDRGRRAARADGVAAALRKDLR